MRLIDAALPTFARHETFHPRYGWFRKAFAACAQDPYIFTQPDAPVTMGVGKNMVRSIRFWGLAAKVIVEDSRSSGRSRGCVPTRFGNALFGDSGWDPYMEDPGTLWLLHWLLLAPRSRLPVWWLAFNEFSAVEFREADLEMSISTLLGGVVGGTSPWPSPSQSSIKKDLGVLLRTYAPSPPSTRSAIDDVLNCPLRELNLISSSAEVGRHRFTLGNKPTLPAEIATYAVLDWIARTHTASSTVTIGRLANDPGSPGRAFKLSEAELGVLLESCVSCESALNLTTVTGVKQLVWSKDPAEVAPKLLDRYFDSVQEGMLAGSRGDCAVDDEVIEALGFGRDRGSVMRRLNEPPALSLGAV